MHTENFTLKINFILFERNNIMDYENKKKALFECLDAAEKNLEGSCLKQKDTERRNIKRPHRSNERRDKSIERYKSKDSIFKRPELPINKVLPLRKVPDYEVLFCIVAS